MGEVAKGKNIETISMVNSLWFGISNYRAKRSENTALRLRYVAIGLGVILY